MPSYPKRDGIIADVFGSESTLTLRASPTRNGKILSTQHMYAHLRIEDCVQADVAILQLERLNKAVYVVVPHLGHQRLVWIDPHASHTGLFPHGSLAVEPAHNSSKNKYPLAANSTPKLSAFSLVCSR